MEEKKQVYKKWWFWVIVAIVIFVIVGSSGDNNNSTVTPSGENTTENVTKEENKRVNVGEKYQDNSISITYLSLNDNFTAYSQYADIKSGYKVIKLDFEFENLSSTDEFVSSINFNCYADGYECEEFLYVDDAIISADLSSGKKAKGSIYFEIPQNASEIEVEYTINSWTDEKIIFVVK